MPWRRLPDIMQECTRSLSINSQPSETFSEGEYSSIIDIHPTSYTVDGEWSRLWMEGIRGESLLKSPEQWILTRYSRSRWDNTFSIQSRFLGRENWSIEWCVIQCSLLIQWIKYHILDRRRVRWSHLQDSHVPRNRPEHYPLHRTRRSPHGQDPGAREAHGSRLERLRIPAFQLEVIFTPHHLWLVLF